MLDSFPILLLFPLLGAAINGLVGKRLPERAAGIIACSSVFLSFAVAVLSFFELLGLPHQERVHSVELFTWIQAGDFASQAAFLFDPLSAVMILVVTGVGFLIHLYSMGYMQGEDGYYRYFSYLNLFIFMMSVLVLADNYLLMFVGWEGVGLCSFLLIGYYFKERFAGDAAKRAFIVNRIGDFAFLLGMFLLFSEFGSIAYLDVFENVSAIEPESGFGILSVITLLFFIGATGKSAQIPLFVWLPDAMAGPTPVSALIHAATMVTAGVYMIARSSALYSRAPDTLLIVAVVALATALLSALIAVAQRDIKKVLAYSTVSQLGYMFLACGVGAYSAGIFHLMTHAFFKALLFLGSGSVILAMHHQQDLFKMGGLRKYLPWTWGTMGIATLAIAGFPFLSGFFSKDEILWEAYSSPLGGPAFYAVGALVAGLTSFYMFRLMFLCFHGEERIEMGEHHDDHGQGNHGDDHGHDAQAVQHKPKEPGWIVLLPLVLLAVLAVIGGWVGLPPWLSDTNQLHHFLEPSFEYRYVAHAATQEHHDHTALELTMAGLAVALGLVGFLVAYWGYAKDPDLPGRVSRRFAGAYQLMRNKFLVDELYDTLFVYPIQWISRNILWRLMDASVIDGLVNGVAALAQIGSQMARRLQTGYVRSYAAWVVFGTVLIFVFYFTS
ncbi:MAG TPA: NADH-quinone oxidoreductase subunit L [Acidobacteriota bacterium]|nr:NADH-quinone oxidoreductase subunit L [Acidobacteriota bacterium]